MRKIVDLIILFLLLAFLFWQKEPIGTHFNYLVSGPCDRPITYRLGEIDSGYGLSRQQFLVKVDQANQIWSKLVAKNLFAEATEGKLIVNLIYSDRQSMADNLNQLEGSLKTGKQSLEASVLDFKALQADFEKKLAAFNQEIESWNKQSFSANKRGGAPEDVFNQLKNRQEELKAEADKLNSLAGQLNLSVSNYNLSIGQYNQKAQNLNAAIAAKPEAGLYNGSIPKIDIYLTSSNQELIHTLAHEMGHALGLNHISDPNSIMYPYTSEIVTPDTQEKTTLIIYCSQKNWEIVLNKIENNLREKINQVKNEFK